MIYNVLHTVQGKREWCQTVEFAHENGLILYIMHVECSSKLENISWAIEEHLVNKASYKGSRYKKLSDSKQGKERRLRDTDDAF